jgi:signal transduction histidine kinase
MASDPNVQSDSNKTHATTLADLRRLERLFADCTWPGRRVFVQARKRAREHALRVLEGAGQSAGARQTALLVAAADLFGALLLERACPEQDAAVVAHHLQELTGLSAIALAREVLRAPELLGASPDAAVEVLLATLIALAPLRSVSLWVPDKREQARCMCHLGQGAPSRRARALAMRLLSGHETEPSTPSARRLLIGLPVGFRQPIAVLVGYARAATHDRCQALLGEAVPMLGATLERAHLLEENAASERTLVQASERKLTRLAFDLHDGPIQNVAMLAQDLRLFGDQLEPLLGKMAEHELVRGRIEDLDAQLVALHAELRRLSSEVHAASTLDQPFSRTLRERVHAFATRTGIEPSLTLTGEVDMISSSQQIALSNIIHEALNNIREHANATNVQIAVSADARGVRAQILDDGQGFELESTRMRAAREGHVGLLAINERVRLLGGHCRIESRPGGPTSISIALERWLLPAAEQHASA